MCVCVWGGGGGGGGEMQIMLSTVLNIIVLYRIAECGCSIRLAAIRGQ